MGRVRETHDGPTMFVPRASCQHAQSRRISAISAYPLFLICIYQHQRWICAGPIFFFPAVLRGLSWGLDWFPLLFKQCISCVNNIVFFYDLSDTLFVIKCISRHNLIELTELNRSVTLWRDLKVKSETQQLYKAPPDIIHPARLIEILKFQFT